MSAPRLGSIALALGARCIDTRTIGTIQLGVGLLLVGRVILPIL